VTDPNAPQAGGAAGRAEFARRVVIVAGVAVLTVAVAAALYLAADVFFLAFLGLLLAVLLRTLSDALDRRTKLGPSWSLALVVFVLLVLSLAAATFLGTSVAAQADRLTDELPRAVEQLRAYLAGREWGQVVLEHVPTTESILTGERGDVATAATRFFTTTLGLVGGIVIVAFLGVYLAADPRLYTEGVLLLVPPRRRPRGREVIAAVGFHLRWWLIGRLIAMLSVGLMVGVGLWALGLQEFLVLALLAFVLDIVPYFGPIVAAVPAVLLALLDGTDTALWVVALYTAVQAVEGYLITPIVQQRTVELPPAVTILAIVVAGALFGLLGIVSATPLIVIVMVVVKMLYVEDALGEELGVPGADPAGER
jgi:predicted PurR-regulated permease PerM